MFWCGGRIAQMDFDKWPTFTLQRLVMVVCVVCIWAAQMSIQNRYQQSPFSDLALTEVPRLTAITVPPIETRALGAVNFFIVCAALAFRRYGKATAWTAIAAACIATAIAALVAAFRYSG